MKKTIFLIVIFLLFIGIILFYLFHKEETVFPEEDAEVMEEEEIIVERITEITYLEDKEELFRDLFEEESVPEAYEGRLGAFSVKERVDDEGLVKDLMIFPLPVTPLESFDISLWTRTLPGRSIENVEGIIDLGDGNTREVEFFSRITQQEGRAIEKHWVGSVEYLEREYRKIETLPRERPSDFEFSAVGEHKITITAYDGDKEKVDQIEVEIVVKDPEEIFDTEE